MCLGSSQSAPEAPAPAPAPPAEAPAAPVVNADSANANGVMSANRRGRNSLRIDRTSTAGGSSGLNIPT